MRVLLALLFVSASVLSVGAQPFSSADRSRAKYSVADAAPSKTCSDLSSFAGEGIVSIASRVVAATADTPQHCRVTGIITPEVAFEINLPDRWNRRFYMAGNGGLAGDALDLPTNADRTGALAHGFVMARTNTGHDARKEPSGSFILSNPQKAIDYAYRAVHVTAETAKRVAVAYYAKPITFSYWNSCSNGGRQGLLEAQRFPDDFNGIVANAPWVDQTGFMIGAMWNQKALAEAPVPLSKLTLVAEKAMAKCDEVDGLKDGLIDDPRKCSFDPTRDVPACAQGTDTPDCLTAAQAATIKKIYGGPVSNGKPFFPGYMVGSEAIVPGPNGAMASTWANSIIAAPTAAQPTATAADFNLAQGIMRYLVLDPPQPEYDPLTFDFDRDIRLVTRWSGLADAKDPDLSKFRKNGGKLIMTYGWADQILQPLMGVNYYESMIEKNGRKTADFARLFMVPGMSHCAGGIGPDRNDAVTAVIDWVEKGKAPDQLIASKVTNGSVVRTRPLCPYPQVARYKGDGSIDDAENFKCVAPK
ncbi:MAG: tannase/feruloyl esterase family alpha/beta hydrolase [Acidobacteriota bacterium]